MKKNILSFILGGIVFLTIGASAAYVYTASDIGYQPQDNTWEVTNADQALTSLKEDLNTVNTNVTKYKNNIAQTLTENGITTNSNDSFETIDNNIDDGINNYKSQINTCNSNYAKLNSNYSTLNTNFTNYKKGVTTALKNKGVNVTENSTLAQVQSGINNMSTTYTATTYEVAYGSNWSSRAAYTNNTSKTQKIILCYSDSYVANSWNGITIYNDSTSIVGNGYVGYIQTQLAPGKSIKLTTQKSANGRIWINVYDEV